MELSILVAKIVAISYISVAFALLSGELKSSKLMESFEKSPGLTLITGYFALILGSILVQYHNIWVNNWTVLITLIGWVALIKGFLFIAFPSTMFKMSKVIIKNKKSWGIFSLALGLLFGYFGFIA